MSVKIIKNLFRNAEKYSMDFGKRKGPRSGLEIESCLRYHPVCLCAVSSVGRASHWRWEGHRFESFIAHITLLFSKFSRTSLTGNAFIGSDRGNFSLNKFASVENGFIRWGVFGIWKSNCLTSIRDTIYPIESLDNLIYSSYSEPYGKRTWRKKS